MRELLGDIVDAGYGDIAQRIATIWGEPEARDYLQKLIFQDRISRKGFPEKVISALMQIQELLPDKKQDIWSTAK